MLRIGRHKRLSKSEGVRAQYLVAVEGIDDKAHQNSKLFDFFYFYSYLEQCVDRCKSISDSDKLSILKFLEDIILKVCNYSSDIDFFNDCNAIILPEKWGLIDVDKKKYLRIFIQRISDRFNNTL